MQTRENGKVAHISDSGSMYHYFGRTIWDASGVEPGDIGGKIDKLIEAMTDTGERAAQRVQTVKSKMLDETDRKSEECNGMAMIGFSLLSAIALIVAA